MFLLLLSLLLTPPESSFDMHWAEWTKFREQEGQGNSIDSAVKFFVGKPYLVGSLEGDGPEELRYHIDGFDCFTLTEAAIAMCLVKDKDQNAYEEMLKLTRYREGVLDGYESRLHYATEWSDQAVESGILTDVTTHFQGILDWAKEINFMTQHSKFYPKLQDDEIFRRVRKYEETLSKRKRHYLPLEKLELNSSRFRAGDIIMILTKKEGLDVAHFCYVTKCPNTADSEKNIQMVHASSTRKAVVEVENMFEYLRHYPKILGIMVFRIKNI